MNLTKVEKTLSQRLNDGFKSAICAHKLGCYPTRMKLLNYINVPGYANLFLELTKLFLNKKLRERFHFYSRQTAHDCFKDMPVNILPVEYGGTDEYWKKVIEENREWLINDEKYRPVLN
ncbi:uncharacterized protein LOC114937027 isoform X2 [Nylanderia fulva]|uniref:uncharacterized protein LOC114937027 isoform X2 n=1 Tax=Nylanderia fulva TaxID=613905 RepID=UPI0010FB001D|nr:uncharacterized protein LOC114937027 isoform X2 [Nylanderia fulva]